LFSTTPTDGVPWESLGPLFVGVDTCCFLLNFPYRHGILRDPARQVNPKPVVRE